MHTLHMMVGIPGSGKTTYAKKLSKKLNCPIISTDVVRNENPNCPEKNIWPIAYSSCAKALEKSDAIFDATNITPVVRNRLIAEIKKFGVDFIIAVHFIKADVDVCFERIKVRNEDKNERFFPPEVVFSYGRKLIEPLIEEGFDSIEIIHSK